MEKGRAEMFGELMAYKLALEEAVEGHPFAALLAARFDDAKQRGLAVLIGQPFPDEAIAGFEHAMDKIVASVSKV